MHIPHIEDLMFTEGKTGITNSLTILEDIFHNKIQAKIKWDGAPAVVFGIHPETKKFFVGTKAALSPNNPKICYTNEDIDSYYSMVSNLAEKLKACLNYLPLTEPDGVYLGDFLFYREKVNTFSPSYDEFFEFTPNTITYQTLVPSHAKLGIAVHTKVGESLDYNVSKEQFNHHKNVWLIDANMETNPIFNLNDEAVLANNKDLAKSLFGAISDDFDTYLQNTNMLKCNLMNFIWKSYQNGEKLDFDTMNAFKTADKFIEFVEDNFKANPITRNYNIKKREEFLHDIKHNFRNDLIFLFSMFGYVSSFKLFIMSRLQSATPVKTNINGSPCLHEGFVVSKTKLVDRETFCKVNYDNNTKRKAAQNGR